MSKPTRGQWRGYAVLCVLLALALAILILAPHRSRQPNSRDNEELLRALEEYGEEIYTANENRRASYRESFWNNDRQQVRNWRRDSVQYRPHYDKKDRTVKVELNSADTTELQLLYGIGPVFAKRIVKYRTLLGGFARKEQLLEVYGMTEERYAEIAGNITVDSSVTTKLDINSATIAQLKRHPYLDYYQAKAIVDYRIKVGNFNGINELLKVATLDEETIAKLEGYIQFN